LATLPLALRILFCALLATAGMIYELALAHLLSVVLGGTLLQYSVTIGLFTLSLGLASLFFPRLPDCAKTAKAFALFQLLTALTAIVAGISLAALFTRGISTPVAYLAYVPALLVGLLTGVELPLLLQHGGPESRSACIAADYAGMFAATLLFPLALLPAVGPLGAIAAGAALNVGCAALGWLA
jgi:spermidine synthase